MRDRLQKFFENQDQVLQLCAFVCRRFERHGLDVLHHHKSPWDYIDEAADEMASGEHAHAGRKRLFRTLCVLIAERIAEDAEKAVDPN